MDFRPTVGSSAVVICFRRFLAARTNGHVSSLTDSYGSIETMGPEVAFDDVTYTLADGTSVDANGRRGYFNDDRDTCFTVGMLNGLSFNWAHVEQYVDLTNGCGKPASFTDPNLTVPLNCRMT